MIKNKNIILNCLKNNLKRFKEQYNVEQLGLFGSYAKNTQSKYSDIDIAYKINYNEYIERIEKIRLRYGINN